MASNRFERIIRGSFQEQSALVDANVVIEDLDIIGSGSGFTIEWDELGLLSAGRSEQNFFLTGLPDGPVRGQDGNERSTTATTTVSGQTLVWTVEETSETNNTVNFLVRAELPYRSDSTADLRIYNGASFSEVLDGTSRNELVFLEGGNDTYYSSDENSSLNGGVDEVYGNSGNDVAHLRNRDAQGQQQYAGFFDGGTGNDSLMVNGGPFDYRIFEHGDTLVFRHKNFSDESGLGRAIAKAKNIENFDGVPLSVLTIENAFSLRAKTATADPAKDLGGIRDFDGNDLGAASAWKHIGTADAQYDNDAEHVYVNPRIGRWATVGPDANGNVDFGNHGKGGDTRVVGIYIDPLVESGEVERNSDFDSQRRFQNDLFIDNLELRTAFDFDADGFQEMYFRVTDGTAYLRALMHADGNIQYANYQNEDQVRDYLTGLGYGAEVVDTILV